MATWLVAATGNNQAPAYYVMAIAGVSTMFVFAIRRDETGRVQWRSRVASRDTSVVR